MNPTINPGDVFGRGFCISTAAGKLPFGDGDGKVRGGAGGEANLVGCVKTELASGDGAESTGTGDSLRAVKGSGGEVDGVS